VRDMTCDSDGRIDHYVDGDGIEATLPLPEGEDTKLLAFFLTGAYQEILGICTTSLVTPTPWTSGLMIGAPPGNPHGPGQTLENVLEQVNYRPQRLLEQLSAQLDDAGLPPSERFQLLERVRKGLESYTYLAAD